MYLMTHLSSRLAILAVVAGVLGVPAIAPAASFTITLDTSVLSGTQTLAFGLTNADGGVNDISLSAFAFGGGAAVAGTDDCTLGGTLSGLSCSGDLMTGVAMDDREFQAFFNQQFTPGGLLSFVLTTTNDFAGPFPDQFAMYVCDGTFAACYSDDAGTAAMLLLDLAGGTLTVADFVTHGAAMQGLPAPIVTPLPDTPTVPEPGTLILLGTGLAIAAGRRKRLTRARYDG